MPSADIDNGLSLFLSEEPELVSLFAEEEKVPLSRSIAIFAELYKFLYLCAEETEPLAPSQSVDSAWHLVLRNRTAYTSLCGAIGGEIKHIPHEQPVPAAYQNCLAAMRSYFGPLDSTIWGRESAARCVGQG